MAALEPARSTSMRSVQWLDDALGRRNSLERALMDRYFAQEAAYASISPRTSTSAHHHPSASGQGARGGPGSTRSTACNTTLPQRGSVTPSSNTSGGGGGGGRARGSRQRRASRSPTRRPPLPPPSPGSPAAATLDTLAAARLCGAVHKQSIPRSWKQELERLRQAAAGWNDAQARHQCCRGLVAQVAGLLLVPELQPQACALLADLGERWPPALAGAAAAAAAHLQLPLARPAARGEALRLAAALAGCGEAGRAAITASPQLLRAVTAPLEEALAVLPRSRKPKAAAPDHDHDDGGGGGGDGGRPVVQKPGQRWGGQREEAWGPGMQLDGNSRKPPASPHKASPHASAAKAASVQVVGGSVRVERVTKAKAAKGLFTSQEPHPVWQQVPDLEQGAQLQLHAVAPSGIAAVDEAVAGAADSAEAVRVALEHAAGAAKTLVRLLTWRASALKVCQVHELAVDPLCRLFEALARRHLEAEAAAAVAAQAADAEGEGPQGGGDPDTAAWGPMSDGAGGGGGMQGGDGKATRRRARVERRHVRLRVKVLKLLLACMQHLAALQAPCQRMVRTSPKGHFLLPIALQLLAARPAEDFTQAHEDKQHEQFTTGTNASATAASGEQSASCNALQQQYAKHGAVLAACALRYLGAVGEQADGETRGALREALGEDESGALHVLVTALRAEPPRLRAASRAALLLWVAASGESAYTREDLVLNHKALSAVAGVLQMVLRGCQHGAFVVEPPPPPPEPSHLSKQASLQGAASGGIAEGAGNELNHTDDNAAGDKAKGSDGGKGNGTDEPPAPEPPPPPPQDSFVLSTDSDDEPVERLPAVLELPEGAAAGEGDTAAAAEASADNGTTDATAADAAAAAADPSAGGVGGVEATGGRASGSATPVRQASGGSVSAAATPRAGGSGDGGGDAGLGDMSSPTLGGGGVPSGDTAAAEGVASPGSGGREAGQDSEDSGGSSGEEPGERGAALGPRRYEKHEVQQLLSNCLALASALLSLLASGSRKRDDVVKAVSPALPAIAATAAVAARDASDASGSGWGLEVRERALAVLANMCLHEETAIAAAHCGAAPAIAMEVVKAALAHLTTPPAMAAPAPLRRAASAPAPAPASPAASKQPRSHNRSVMQAPATLLTQAAAILANYMRAQPSLRDAEAAASMAESYDFHAAPAASVEEESGAAGGEGTGGGDLKGGGAAGGSLLSHLPQGWEFEPQAALQLVCEAVPGACSHVEPLETAPPRPRSGPTVSASQATAPLSVAPSIAAAPPQQLLLVQSLAAATACLSRGVERGSGGGKRTGHASSPAAAQAALLFADHVPLTCWTARGSGSSDAPRPEASAAGAACVSACWALLACGHVHPELDGLLDKLLPSIAALVRQGTAAGRKGRAPPDPWPVLLLAAQLCRSRRVAARLLAHTPTGEALVAEQLRRGGGDGEGGLLLQLLLELRYVDRYKLLNPLKLPKCEPPRTVESLVGKPAQRAFGAAPEGQQFMSMADLAPELAAMMAADPDRDKPFRSAAASKPPDAATAEGEASVGGQGGGDGGEGGSSGVGGGGGGGVGGSGAGSAAVSAEPSRVLRPESTQGSVVSASGQQQVPGSAGGDGHGLPGLTATANSSKLGTPAAGVSPEASSLSAAQASQGRLQASTSAGAHGVLGAAAGQPASGGVSGAASMESLGG